MATRLTPRFDAAVALARDLHDGQLRKGTEIPYLSHLLAVAGIVLEAGGSEDEAIAALLHDDPEDAGGRATLAAIRERFGDEVAAIVDACTDTYEEPKPDWPARKRAYVAHLEGPATPDGALLVSLADKLHNARAIVFDLRVERDALWARFRTGSGPAQLWYYRALADVFLRRRPGPLAEELDRTVREMERLAAEVARAG
jgi:(p)ppGpp synthase/HD superfamily hydrolase